MLVWLGCWVLSVHSTIQQAGLGFKVNVSLPSSQAQLGQWAGFNCRPPVVWAWVCHWGSSLGWVVWLHLANLVVILTVWVSCLLLSAVRWVPGLPVCQCLRCPLG